MINCRRVTHVALTMFGALSILTAPAEEAKPDVALDHMSIEELLNVEVSSAARKPQRQLSVPAASFVITRDDIARSTATTIPDLLRMAPGVHVARIDASKWSVTIRGFSGRLADKLLVLVDGRSIYTPTFSGTIWEDVNYPLELIEHIEIIRGPGGAIWGANAVNGIINIITRQPEDMDGGLISLSAGTDLDGKLSALYGGPVGKNRFARFYLQDHHGDKGGLTRPGVQDDDNWNATQAGAMMTWKWDHDRVSVGLDGLSDRLHDTYSLSPYRYPYRPYVANNERTESVTFTGSWERTVNEDSNFRLHTAYQHYDSTNLIISEIRNTGDLDFEHRLRISDRHELVWGLGFRYTEDHTTRSILAQFTPDRRRLRTFSGFVQDEITLVDDTLWLTLGTKLEHNDFTGFEVQPTIRLAWTPTPQTTLWAAATRAVGTPSRAESDVRFRALSLPGVDAALVGSDDFESESVITLEAGLRHVLSETLTADISVFYSDYDNFRTTSLKPPFFSLQFYPPRVSLDFVADNDTGAITKGVEMVLDWQPRPRWRTRLVWSYLDIDVTPHTPYPDFVTSNAANDTPTHQVNWQHQFELSRKVELDLNFRFVDALTSFDVGAYSTLDVRLGWKPRKDLTVELAAQNLFQPEHSELAPDIIDTLPSKSERGIYGQVTWEF